MIIKTITCHHVYNFGATLQAYALQHYLVSLGHYSEIINFVPWYHNRYSFWHVNRFSSHYNIVEKNFILKLLWCVRFNMPNLIREYGRKRAFDKFDKKYLKISKKKYSTIEELRQDPPNADRYICGSDQIWNPNATNGIEKAYYLDFGKPKTFKVSYAASFGGDCIPENSFREVKSLLDNINKISVRESSGKKFLDKIGKKGVKVVLDPVFLLGKEKWEELTADITIKNMPPKYILLYNFKENNSIKDFVLRLQSKLGIPIVCIHGYDTITFADYVFKNMGPLEFLLMIQNAEVVVSDSFHATVFSIIFNKDFYTFSLKGQDNIARMRDLMICLDIKNRLNPKETSENINYIDVMHKLGPMLASSKQFLKDALEESKSNH